MIKSTASEIEDRVTVVMELLIEKKKRSEIVLFCAEKWGISERHTTNYIRKATVIRQNKYIDNYRDSIVYKSVKRMEELYGLNFDNEDFAECLKVVVKQNELLGTITKKIEKTSTKFTINRKNADRD